MRVIIAGSRTLKNQDSVHLDLDILLEGVAVTCVLSGCAKGADTMGATWAARKGIPIRAYHPDWNGQGKAAGPIRNRKMAENADMLIAFWDGKSRGTKNMIEEAEKKGLVVHVIRV